MSTPADRALRQAFAAGLAPSADPALRGLEGGVPGSSCTTPCKPGCEVTCHERCDPSPAHDQFYCDQIRLGRDVSEYRPDIRQAFAQAQQSRSASRW